MYIEIVIDLPVEEEYKPIVGKVYEVVKIEKNLKFIMVNGRMVGVYPTECRLVKVTNA